MSNDYILQDKSVEGTMDYHKFAGIHAQLQATNMSNTSTDVDGGDGGGGGGSKSEYVSDGFLITLQVVIVLVMLVGIPGNLTVIYVVIRNKHLQTSGAILIVLLSTADLLYYLIVLPMRFVTFYNADWIFEQGLCSFVAGMAHYCFGVSMSSMSAIAFSRYLHVLHHSTYKKMFGKVGLTIQISFMTIFLGIWIIALPMAGIWGNYTYQESILSCTFNPEGNASYKYLMMSAAILIPLLFTVLCYSLIYFKVKAIRSRMQRWNPRVAPGMGESSMNEHSTSGAPSVYIHNIHRTRELSQIREEIQVVDELQSSSRSNRDAQTLVSSSSHSTNSRDPHALHVQPILKPTLKRSTTQTRLKRVNISLENNILKKFQTNSIIITNTTTLTKTTNAAGAVAAPSMTATMTMSKAQQRQRRRDSLKMTLMMMITFGLFLFCIAPYAIVGLVDTQQTASLAYLLTLMFTWLNGCFNPIIYMAMNTQYREAFKDLLPYGCWGDDDDEE